MLRSCSYDTVLLIEAVKLMCIYTLECHLQSKLIDTLAHFGSEYEFIVTQSFLILELNLTVKIVEVFCTYILGDYKIA